MRRIEVLDVNWEQIYLRPVTRYKTGENLDEHLDSEYHKHMMRDLESHMTQADIEARQKDQKAAMLKTKKERMYEKNRREKVLM
jgi:hypothetical protein